MTRSQRSVLINCEAIDHLCDEWDKRYGLRRSISNTLQLAVDRRATKLEVSYQLQSTRAKFYLSNKQKDRLSILELIDWPKCDLEREWSIALYEHMSDCRSMNGVISDESSSKMISKRVAKERRPRTLS